MVFEKVTGDVGLHLNRLNKENGKYLNISIRKNASHNRLGQKLTMSTAQNDYDVPL